ncbi:peroxidase 20 [Aristolochia californica]|uniref:peroxidase 20 n=1 Tax=Aristolochia californica TaxID=171875 RepID=UPI0035DC4603
MGCDASVLLDNGVGVASEKDAGPNLNSLRGFDVVDKIKFLLEKACPGTVSCADLLAVAARDAVNLRGGPYWEVELGRRDSLAASQIGANQYIPTPNSTLEILIANFAVQGLSPTDLVVLSGSHTIGRSRCLSFKQRIYTEIGEEEYDHHRRYSGFRRILRSICPRTSKRDNALVPLDFMTSTRFDNLYFRNVLQGKGLLQTDNVLVAEDPEGEISNLVWRFAADQHLFFREFALSIVKMGRINPLVGEEGEIRRNCRVLNSW